MLPTIVQSGRLTETPDQLSGFSAPQSHEIAREHREPVVVTLSGAVLDRDVAALDETGLIQTLADDRDERGVGRRRTDAEQADYRHGALLRARRERPRGYRAATLSFRPGDRPAYADAVVTSSLPPRYSFSVYSTHWPPLYIRMLPTIVQSGRLTETPDQLSGFSAPQNL
jgi:hypothetical protein